MPITIMNPPGYVEPLEPLRAPVASVVPLTDTLARSTDVFENSLAARRKPTVPRPDRTTRIMPRAEPHITFSEACPAAMRAETEQLFADVVQTAKENGIEVQDQGLNVHYIRRARWIGLQNDRDTELAKQFPLSGIRALWTRTTRWMSRLAHAYTTPIYFEKGPSHDVYVIAENYRSQSDREKKARLAEVFFRSLQQAAFPNFFKVQDDDLKHLHLDPQADSSAYLSSERFVEAHVALCLRDLEEKQVMPPAPKRWLPSYLAFWRPRPDRALRAVVEELRHKPDVGETCAAVFKTPSYSRLLFQRGGRLELSDKQIERSRSLIDWLRSRNPVGAPRLVRSSVVHRP
jgi:hypothetical protein